MDRLRTKHEPGPERLVACERAGAQYRERAITATAAWYDRTRHLPKILAATPVEIGDWSRQGQSKLITRLLRLARN